MAKATTASEAAGSFCYCAGARRVARALVARYDAALAPAGMTAAQYEVLSALDRMDGASGTALAGRLQVDKTTLSRGLKALLEAGLVKAGPAGEDRRSVHYALSAAGRRKLAKAGPLWQEAHDATVALLRTEAGSAEKALRGMAATLQMA